MNLDVDALCDSLLETLEELLTLSFLRRMQLLLSATHPWVAVSRLSISMPATMAALVLTTELLTSLALSALWFSGAESPASCSVESEWAKAKRSIAVGVISSLLGGLPLAVVLKFRDRDFVYISKEDLISRRRQLRKWFIEDVIVWLFCMAYCGLAVLFITAFIANVDEADREQWLISSISSLCEEALVVPVMTAAVFASLSTTYAYAHAKLPTMSEHVKVLHRKLLVKEILGKEYFDEDVQTKQVGQRESPDETKQGVEDLESALDQPLSPSGILPTLRSVSTDSGITAFNARWEATGRGSTVSVDLCARLAGIHHNEGLTPSKVNLYSGTTNAAASILWESERDADRKVFATNSSTGCK
jgi:hypothetical protein